MPQRNDLNSKDIVINIIDNPVNAFADAVTVPSFEFFTSMRPWVQRQGLEWHL
jgi:hypothetical protein